MNKVTFITGNQNKANFLMKYLGVPVNHHKLELEEIQSLELDDIVDHKLMQAYEAIEGPVIVEDVGLSFKALGGKLPGAFTKWFLEEVGTEGLCRMLDSYESRAALAQICYGYYDGQHLHFFEGEVEGTIAGNPRGTNGFGWDSIFIPRGTDKTLAEMDDKETERFSLRTATVYPALKRFLQELDKS
jgi:non-canonical purine NTP pyrophosphatase (RdgB/HAM1 family)